MTYESAQSKFKYESDDHLVKHYVTEKTNSPRAALTEPLMRAQMDSHGSLSIKLEKLVVSTLFSILILVLTVKLKDMICLGFFLGLYNSK